MSALCPYRCTGTNAGGAQQQGDGVGSAGAADRETRAAGRGELGFERLQLRAEHVPPPLGHAIDRGANESSIVAGAEVDEADGRRAAHSAAGCALLGR
jgi:hypothetical protein